MWGAKALGSKSEAHLIRETGPSLSFLVSNMGHGPMVSAPDWPGMEGQVHSPARPRGPPLISPPHDTAPLTAMVELDGDDVRISSRGKLAERDIVQVKPRLCLPHGKFKSPSSQADLTPPLGASLGKGLGGRHREPQSAPVVTKGSRSPSSAMLCSGLGPSLSCLGHTPNIVGAQPEARTLCQPFLSPQASMVSLVLFFFCPLKAEAVSLALLQPSPRMGIAWLTESM